MRMVIYGLGSDSRRRKKYYLNLLNAEAKKNNCVVRVTAEKTFGRVGRYFFCDGSHVG